MSAFTTSHVPQDYANLAPDGSEIRPLAQLSAGNMVHCVLPAGAITQAVTHRTVEEIWYIVSGRGEIWRKQGDQEAVDNLVAETCVTIPLGTHFQFRNVGDDPLVIIICTMPPWSGADEAEVVDNFWDR